MRVFKGNMTKFGGIKLLFVMLVRGLAELSDPPPPRCKSLWNIQSLELKLRNRSVGQCVAPSDNKAFIAIVRFRDTRIFLFMFTYPYQGSNIGSEGCWMCPKRRFLKR